MTHFFSTVASLIRKNALVLTVLGLGAGALIAAEGEVGDEMTQELGDPVALEVIPEADEVIAPESIVGNGILVGAENQEIMPANVDELYIELKNERGAVLAQWNYIDVQKDGVWVDAEGDAAEAGADGAICIGYKLGTEYALSNGVYTFSIPEGFFHITEVTGEGEDDVVYHPNEAVEVTWTLFDPNTEVALNVEPQATDASDPENASIARVALESVQIFAGDEDLPLDMHPSHNDEIFVTLTNAMGVELGQWSQDELQEALVLNEDNLGLGFSLDVAQYITDAGVYTLNIPKGAIEVAVEGLDGVYAPNAEKVVTWAVKEPFVELTVEPQATDASDPENASIAKVALEEVQIFAGDGEEEVELLTNNEDDLYITLTNGMNIVLAQFDYKEVVELAVRNEEEVAVGYKLDLAQFITDAGEYTLTIPAGFFDAKQSEELGFSPNAEKVVKWTVLDPNATFELNVEPQGMSEENPSISAVALEEVQIFAGDGEEEVELLTMNKDDLFITLVNGMGVELVRYDFNEVLEFAVRNEDDLCIGYKLDLAQYITDNGEYTLTIPEGFFDSPIKSLDGVFLPNAEKVVHWFVLEPYAQINVLPEATDESDPENASIAPVALEEVQIFAGEAEEPVELLLNHLDDVFVTLTNQMGVVLAQFDYKEMLEVAVHAEAGELEEGDGTEEAAEGVCIGYKLNLAEYITDGGVYTLNIPAGFFDVFSGVDGVFAPNAEKVVTWTVLDPNARIELNVEPQATDVSETENAYIAPVALEQTLIFAGNGEDEQPEILTTHNDELFVTLTNAMDVVLAQWNHLELMECAVNNDDDVCIGYKLDLAQYITDSGVYTLNIPESMFQVALATVEGVFVENAAKTVTWTVLEPEAEINVEPQATSVDDPENASIAPVALEETLIFAGNGEEDEVELLCNNLDDVFVTLTNKMGIVLAQFDYKEMLELAVRNEAEVAVGYKVNLAEYITDSGEYTLTIPAGFFDVAVAGIEGAFVPNAEKVVTWFVLEPEAQINVLPEATVEGDPENYCIAPVALEETMIFAGNGEDEEVELLLNNLDEVYMTLTNKMGVVLAQFDYKEVMECAVKNEEDVTIGYKVNLAEYITDSGEYTLTIPAGMFDVAVAGLDGIFVPNAEKVVTWFVLEPYAEINVLPEATVAEDEENYCIAPVALEETMIFAGNGEEDEVELLLNHLDDVFVTLTNQMGVVLAQFDSKEVMECAVKNEEDVTIGYKVNLAEYITDSGEYTLTIPAGMFDVAVAGYEGVFVPNLAKSVTWFVLATEAPIYVSPENGEEIANVALEKFFVAANEEADSEIILTHNDELFITLTNEMGVVIGQWNKDEVFAGATYNDDDICIGFTWDASEGITDVGEYTITIPAGFFQVAVPVHEGVFVPNAEMVVVYKINKVVDAINAIFSDVDTANGFNVSTINGINVLRSGKSADLKNLENGLYIINGKKVYIRK